MSKAIVQGTIQIPIAYLTDRMKKAYTHIKKGYGGLFEVYYGYSFDKEFAYISRNLTKFRKHCDLPFEYKLVDSFDIEGELREGFSLRPHQASLADSILTELESNCNIFFQAEVRFGKTFTTTYIISKLKKRTLVLVDKTLLVEQFVSDMKEYSTFTPTILNKLDDISDVTITTFQFLHANPQLLDEIKDKFPIVVIDEAHCGAASTYMNIIEKIPSRYRISMSATPTRSDGKSQVLYDMLGDITLRGVNKNALVADLRIFELDKAYYPSSYNPKASLANYLTSPEIALQIYKLIAEYRGKTIMIVSDLKKVQTFYSSNVLNSDTPKARRTELMVGINSGDTKIFSGYGVMLKGVTLPKLEVIIHLFAATTQENVQQLHGRLLTPPNGEDIKSPIFVEVQTRNGSFKESQREKWLKELSSKT